VALPVLDKLGKIIDSVTNEYLLLHSYGLIDKIDSNKIGTEITINQIRDLISFTQISAHKNKKVVIINDASKMNKEASAALLKTLEEVSSNCTFILIADSCKNIDETIQSRCQIINLEVNSSQDYGNFKEFFYLNHSFLKSIKSDYNIDSLIDETVKQTEDLLNSSIDPIDTSFLWSKSPPKMILEIVSSYVIYVVKNIISSNTKISIANENLKKLNYIYGLIPSIRQNINMNINSKYILNNLAIELAS
jgi:DNA polymerase III delta prime subunit